MHSRRPIVVHVPVVHSSTGGDRCASQGHARGSPKAGGCQWRPSGRSFDAGAFTTTRAATRHLVNDATRPLRRGRTRWMPTALGSVIWELRKEASSRPGQGVAGREEGSAPRTEGFTKEKPDLQFHGETTPRSTSARVKAPRPQTAQPRGVKASTANAKNRSSAHAQRRPHREDSRGSPAH